MNLGLSTLQARETRNDDDLRPAIPTGGSSQSCLPHRPYGFLPVSEVWPQYRPEGTWVQICAPLWNLMQSSSYRCLLTLLAGCVTWKPGGKKPWQSQIKLQGMAQWEWMVQLPSGASAAIFLWSPVGLCNRTRHAETLIVRCLQD